MQEAIDHLEKHKVFIDTLGTDMIPLSEAYKAIELSVNQQLVETMDALQSGLGQLGIDLQELQNEGEND
jgi:hypothetical protein